MKTIGTLFAGFGGVDIGAMAAGLTPLWAVEYDAAIAGVYRQNIGDHVTVADILQLDPLDFEPVDVLHASPPCPNFSAAKTKPQESEQDIAFGGKVAEFVKLLRPSVLTLENVYGYRKAESFRLIVKTLAQAGYQYRWWHLNSADYGVAQGRRRLILVARLDGAPVRPAATHAPREEIAPLFDDRRPYVSWLDAIEDLAPYLPTAYLKRGLPCPHDPDGRECRESPHCWGHFAPWQEARLPDYFTTMLLAQGISRNHRNEDYGVVMRRSPSEPAFVVTSNGNMQHVRAFLSGGANTSAEQAAAGVGIAGDDEPTLVVTPSGDRCRAFILSNAATEWGDGRIGGKEPAPSVTPQHNGRLRAFVVSSHTIDGSRVATRNGDEVAVTVDTKDGRVRAFTGARVVRITPRALARWQAFPDSYRLPHNRRLATTGIGNAVPPLLYQRVMEAQLQ